MEGPQFSTKAESNLYRSWGMDIIGMTNLAEAKLAREAEICYATLACITDYDCWRMDKTNESVSLDMIIQNLLKNVDISKRIVKSVVPKLKKERDCICASALKDSIITRPELIRARRKTAPGIRQNIRQFFRGIGIEILAAGRILFQVNSDIRQYRRLSEYPGFLDYGAPTLKKRRLYDCKRAP